MKIPRMNKFLIQELKDGSPPLLIIIGLVGLMIWSVLQPTPWERWRAMTFPEDSTIIYPMYIDHLNYWNVKTVPELDSVINSDSSQYIMIKAHMDTFTAIEDTIIYHEPLRDTIPLRLHLWDERNGKEIWMNGYGTNSLHSYCYPSPCAPSVFLDSKKNRLPKRYVLIEYK